MISEILSNLKKLRTLIIGNGEVDSSILSGSTIQLIEII